MGGNAEGKLPPPSSPKPGAFTASEKKNNKNLSEKLKRAH